jgi:similar to stage IV sporulation protein
VPYVVPRFFCARKISGAQKIENEKSYRNTKTKKTARLPVRKISGVQKKYRHENATRLATRAKTKNNKIYGAQKNKNKGEDAMLSNFFSGYIKVEIIGLNIERLLNFITKNDVKIYDAKRAEHKGLILTVRYADRNKLFAIVEEKCYNIRVIRSFGAAYLVKAARKRIACLICVAVAIVAVAAFSSFIWELRITGVKNISAADIKKAAYELGAAKGSYGGGIDCAALQLKLIDKVAGISYATCYIRGVTLFIDVVEAIPDNLPEDKTPRDIYAAFGGTITRMVTINGTPLVKVGDNVSAGQMLISRTVAYPDGTSADVRAAGEIYAATAYTGETEFFEKRTELVATGNFYETRTLNMFGKSIPIAGAVKNYEYAKTERFTSYISALLPITITTARVYEYKPVSVEQTLESALEELQRASYGKALRLLPKGNGISDVKYDIIDNGLSKTIRATLTVVNRIDKN